MLSEPERPMTPALRRISRTRPRALIGGGLLLGLLAGCATPPPANDPEAVAEFRQTNDPLEPTNRVFYKVDDALDKAILVPAAKAYRAVLPSPVRTAIHNVLENLGTPVRLANDVMEGKPLQAGDTVIRFVVNSIFGLGGMIDVGKRLNIPAHDNDFGLTLGRWGVDEGPFLYLPVLGPSGPRDAVGFGADIAMDPLTWVGRGTQEYKIRGYTRTFFSTLDERSSLLDAVDQIKKTALDPYASFRSLYRQNRASKIEKLKGDDPPENHVWMPGPHPAAAKPTQ